MPEQLGWLDTNLFVHALFPRDPHHARCRAIVRALEEGRAEGWLDPLVVHELSYVLSRLGQRFPTRTAIEEYLRGILLINAIHADDKAGLLETGRPRRVRGTAGAGVDGDGGHSSAR